ncbi:TIGR00730 family Rossman fold protein [Trinickia sp. LjRoot230]|uniref:LOG family protein n=1 Tax=Trinickia sp. LjRoot230 TaxID=3342288 RepID=UPI003ECF524D
MTATSKRSTDQRLARLVAESGEDLAAIERVRHLIESPSYRPADEDQSFLQQPEMCGVRLQLDYWKTESILQARRIAHTIVVYGSTRLIEPAAAERRVSAAKEALAATPHDAGRLKALRVAERLAASSGFYAVAREFGQHIGRLAAGGTLARTAIITGGGPGIMEAANRGAFETDAPSIGLNIALPHKQLPNPYLSPELCFQFHYFAIRKLHLLERARAAVFFPGGFGTCDELFEVLTLLQTGKIKPLPVVLVSERFWRHALNFDFLIDEGMISMHDIELFSFAETATDICAAIVPDENDASGV